LVESFVDRLLDLRFLQASSIIFHLKLPQLMNDQLRQAFHWGWFLEFGYYDDIHWEHLNRERINAELQGI
jgi:hypothetical protein